MASSGLYADTVGRALAHLDVIAGDPARGAWRAGEGRSVVATNAFVPLAFELGEAFQRDP